MRTLLCGSQLAGLAAVIHAVHGFGLRPVGRDQRTDGAAGGSAILAFWSGSCVAVDATFEVDSPAQPLACCHTANSLGGRKPTCSTGQWTRAGRDACRRPALGAAAAWRMVIGPLTACLRTLSHSGESLMNLRTWPTARGTGPPPRLARSAAHAAACISWFVVETAARMNGARNGSSDCMDAVVR